MVNHGCDAQKGCTYTLKVCDDDLCTNDYCESPSGNCIISSKCDDNLSCTVDSCDATTGQCSNVLRICADTDPCTTDYCNPYTGDCESEKIDCDDNKACTDDICVSGFCYHTDKSCDDYNSCTIDDCDTLTGQCFHSVITCDDGNSCTEDSCEYGLCQNIENLSCNDGIDCTFDSCVDDIGCVYTPRDDFCVTNDPCSEPRCTASGCGIVPKDCNDCNPCTTDSCQAGECKHQFHNLCNDDLRCTTDICVPRIQYPSGTPSATDFDCQWNPEPTNCGKLASCQTSECGPGKDCNIISHDSKCPGHPQNISCLAPQCTNAGCGFRDTCDVSNKDCAGCGLCSCQITLNKCVKSCPSKRSLEEEPISGFENGGYMISYSLLFLILCLIFNRM